MAFVRLLLLPFLLLFLSAAAHAEGQRVILVLDASGSMWGQVDGKAKIDIAKSVVGKVISAWKPEDELGLVAYGHREKGSCSDIETLIEPGALDSGFFMGAVKALSPKGKTPMTQAVRAAAESLKFTEQKATVILVSDGIETCDPDPCAVANELEKLGIGLTVHTVGFGLDDQGAVSQLKCLAENTGGISVIADNAEQLEKALNETVKAEPAPAPEPEKAEFNFNGRVIMAEGVDSLPQGFDTPTWEIFTSINGEKGEWVKTEYGAAMKTNVDVPGDHVVQVSSDQARLVTPLTIKAGEVTELDLSFEAGLLKFSAMMDADTPMTDDGAAWELLDGNGTWLTTKYGKEVSYFATGGAYRMRLKLGDATVEQPVVFNPGKIEDVVMTLGGAVIQVSAVFTPGGQSVLDGAAIEQRKSEPGLDGQHEWITTQYGASTIFKTAAGKYRIIAKQDYAEGFADVDAKAGETVKVEVSVNGGFLAATSTADATMEVYSGEKDISGNRKWIGTEYNGQINKAFNVGLVHVVAKKPDGTVIGEKDVEIKGGQRVEVTLP